MERGWFLVWTRGTGTADGAGLGAQIAESDGLFCGLRRSQILLFGFRLFPFGSTAPLASRIRSHQFSFDISMLALKVEIGS